MVLGAHLWAKLCEVGLRYKTEKHQCIFTSPGEKKTLRKGIKHKKPCLGVISLCYLKRSKEAILGCWFISSYSHHLMAASKEWQKVLIEGANGRKGEQKQNFKILISFACLIKQNCPSYSVLCTLWERLRRCLIKGLWSHHQCQWFLYTHTYSMKGY